MGLLKKLFPAVLIAAAILILIFIAVDYQVARKEAENVTLRQELEAAEAEREMLLQEIERLKKEPAGPDPVENAEIFEYGGLVEVRHLDSTIVVDLAYAGADNFTGQVLYQVEVCLLRRDTAEKLAAANAEFARDGYRLKVWDAYRPRGVQKIMWELEPNGVYVADPAVGSNHNRGAAVDVTLVDDQGRELLMPTGFDVFTEEASRDYPGISEEARRNMEYLTEVMVKNGFTPIRSEWWHFNDKDVRQYDFLDLSLEEWVSAYFSATLP